MTWTRVWTMGLLAAVLAIPGCVGGVVPIKTLLDDPGRFEGKSVRIKGAVEEGIGVLGYGTYKVNDGTGTLWVIVQGSGAPRVGAETGVEGEFRSAYTLGDHTAAVVMEKRRFTP